MTKIVKPIKPKDVGTQKSKAFPPEVIEAFNEIIAQKFSGGSATVYQKDVVARIVAKGIKREDIFENNWLDVEEIFEKNGWSVSYDKPAYCESYEPFFEFEAK